VLGLSLLLLAGCADSSPPPGAVFACSGTLCPANYQCRDGYCFPLGGDGGCVPRGCIGDLHCAEISDGCGGTVQCGECAAPKTCGGGGKPNVCGCTGESEQSLCSDAGFTCGAHSRTDHCGVERAVTCGACAAGQVCAPTFSCVSCVAETDVAFCARHNASCGMLSALDNCASLRALSCGTCSGCAADGGACCLARGQSCSYAYECCDGRSCFNGRCERLDGGN